MTTTNSKRTTRPAPEAPEAEAVADAPVEKEVTSDQLPEDHPLKGTVKPPTAPTEPPEPDWKSEAIRLDNEVRFWKTKYFEALQYSQSQAQVIGTLARPQMEAEQRQQAELLAKMVGGLQS